MCIDRFINMFYISIALHTNLVIFIYYMIFRDETFDFSPWVNDPWLPFQHHLRHWRETNVRSHQLPPGPQGKFFKRIQHDPTCHLNGSFLSHRITPSHHPSIDGLFHDKPNMASESIQYDEILRFWKTGLWNPRLTLQKHPDAPRDNQPTPCLWLRCWLSCC